MKPNESRWRIATALGPENLARALADWEEKGIEPRFLTFAGMVAVETPGSLISPSARESVMFPSYTLVGIQRGGK